MGYRVEYSEKALKVLKKMDKHEVIVLTLWIKKNLIGIENPYTIGKALARNKKGQWRYRIGNHRLLVKIEDKELLILVIDVGHRKDIYK